MSSASDSVLLRARSSAAMPMTSAGGLLTLTRTQRLDEEMSLAHTFAELGLLAHLAVVRLRTCGAHGQ